VLLLLLVLSFAHKEYGGGQAVVRGRRNDGFCPMGLPTDRGCRGPGMSEGGVLLVRVGGVGLRRLLPSPFGDWLRRVLDGRSVVELTGGSGGEKGVSVLTGGASVKRGGSYITRFCSYTRDE
jgi:hypothetical protein